MLQVVNSIMKYACGYSIVENFKNASYTCVLIITWIANDAIQKILSELGGKSVKKLF